MNQPTEPNDPNELGLASRVLGGLPIINAVTDRLGLPALLAAALPDGDGRVRVSSAAAIRLVVANLVLGREPPYGPGEWAARYNPALLGLTAQEVSVLNDDRVGRALEALFDADRASLLTAVVPRAISEFSIDTRQLAQVVAHGEVLTSQQLGHPTQCLQNAPVTPTGQSHSQEPSPRRA